MNTRLIARSGKIATLSITFLILISGWCAAANFAADIFTKAGKTTTIGKIYVKGDKARRETVSNGHVWANIVRADKNLTWVMNPIKKEYNEVAQATLITPNEDEMGKFSDKKDAGTETINGHLCKKNIWTSRYEGGGIVTVWRSLKLDWPIKVEVQNKGVVLMTSVMKNIKDTTPNDSLFELPAGYTKAKPEEPAPKKPIKAKK
jgi:hypothetical protein